MNDARVQPVADAMNAPRLMLAENSAATEAATEAQEKEKPGTDSPQDAPGVDAGNGGDVVDAAAEPSP